ncbi:MAG: family 43 glycosylhydrolase [Chitinophagaceae bacterium]|nr:family 43 glycosylhydrolase [Chitinophagaceae bacterium]
MKYCLLFLFAFSCSFLQAQTQKAFIPGEIWKDTNGDPINAHGGGLLYYNGTYYWYGEIKKGRTWRVEYVTSWEDYRVNAGGVSCYSSNDLLSWKFEGVALKPNTVDSAHDLHTSKVIERPKVIYNEKTKKFVMWMHVDSEDYDYSRSGVAVSDKPSGPFTYIGSVRPNGAMARDMTVFRDDDGKAYHFYSSENNATMHVCLLSEDYLSHTKTGKRILINQSREAPAVFKFNGKYYLISSGCTGWSPNPASYAVAGQILGEWTPYDNPCTGPGADTTYGAQSTYVQPVMGKKNAFVFLADRWNKADLEGSRYVWLPMVMKNGKPVIEWKEQWDLSFFK